MTRRQPTLREAEDSVAGILRCISSAKEVRAAVAEHMKPDGFCVRHWRARGWFELRWPFSEIDQRCDDCGCVLQVRRDAGDGFYYDRRWLTENPALRDPRLSGQYDSRHVCLRCFNRVRHALRRAEEIHELRLMIGRIKREAASVQA